MSFVSQWNNYDPILKVYGGKVRKSSLNIKILR